MVPDQIVEFLHSIGLEVSNTDVFMDTLLKLQSNPMLKMALKMQGIDLGDLKVKAGL